MPASIAFKALGIDVRDASGNIRDTNAVFLDIADRFGRMQDGATKSALAMQVFGKSGAELIPLLNSGRDGLKGMAAYAEHAQVLGHEAEPIYAFLAEALSHLAEETPTVEKLLELCLRCGEVNLKVMELLDAANNALYGTDGGDHCPISASGY